MTNRTLFRLFIALVVLGGVAYWINQKPAARVEVGGVTAGDAVFAALDVNNINAIELASISTTITLARAEAGWVVSSLHDYPAEFSPIASFLRSLNELKVDQVLREGEATLEEVGLDPEVFAPDRLAVRLRYATGKPEVTFSLGAQKQAGDGSGVGLGMPRGRFMQVRGGPVIAVAETFFNLGQRAENWVNQQLPGLNPADVVEVEVRRAEGGFVLARGEDGVEFVLRDAGANEEVDSAAANRLFGALQWARFETVIDSGLTDEDVELDGALVVNFHMANNVIYSFEMAATEDASGRVVRLSALDTSADGVNQALVESVNKDHGAWRYKLSSTTIAQLLPLRESLVKVTGAAGEDNGGE